MDFKKSGFKTYDLCSTFFKNYFIKSELKRSIERAFAFFFRAETAAPYFFAVKMLCLRKNFNLSQAFTVLTSLSTIRIDFNGIGEQKKKSIKVRTYRTFTKWRTKKTVYRTEDKKSTKQLFTPIDFSKSKIKSTGRRFLVT